jgi:hypothetical protein
MMVLFLSFYIFCIDGQSNIFSWFIHCTVQQCLTNINQDDYEHIDDSSAIAFRNGICLSDANLLLCHRNG